MFVSTFAILLLPPPPLQDQMIHRESVIALEGMMEMTRNNDGWTLDRTVVSTEYVSVHGRTFS